MDFKPNSPLHPQDLKQRSLRSGLIVFAAQPIKLAIGLSSTAFLARLLTPEAFGLIALSNVFINFMQIVPDQGFAPALIQRQELEPEHLDTAFWSQIAGSILLILITLMTAGIIADGFKQPELKLLLPVLSIVLILNALSSIQKAILKRKFDFQTLAVRSLIGIIICGVVGVVIALNGFGVWSLVGQQITFEIVGVIVLWKVSDWRPRFKFSTQHFWQLNSFSIHLLAFHLLSFLSSRTDNLLVGYYFGGTVLGYYALAHRILQVMLQLIAVTSFEVALSTFSRLQSDFLRLRQVFYQATQFTCLIVFPLFFGVAVLAPELVVVLFGKQWQPSIPLLQILAFAGMLRSISSLNESVLTALGKPDWRFRLGLLNSSLMIIACLIAVQWGIIAVSLACVASDFLTFPASFWAINQLIKVPLFRYLQQFLLAIVATLSMILFILITKHFLESFDNVLLVLSFSLLIGAIVYGLAVQLLAPEMSQKFIGLINLVGSKSSKS